MAPNTILPHHTNTSSVSQNQHTQPVRNLFNFPHAVHNAGNFTNTSKPIILTAQSSKAQTTAHQNNLTLAPFDVDPSETTDLNEKTSTLPPHLKNVSNKGNRADQKQHSLEGAPVLEANSNYYYQQGGNFFEVHKEASGVRVQPAGWSHVDAVPVKFHGNVLKVAEGGPMYAVSPEMIEGLDADARGIYRTSDNKEYVKSVDGYVFEVRASPHNPGVVQVADPKSGRGTTFLGRRGETNEWERVGLRGGGAVLGALGLRLTPEQQVEDDLLKALLTSFSQSGRTPQIGEETKGLLAKLSISQKQTLLDDARRTLKLDEAQFRKVVSDANNGKLVGTTREFRELQNCLVRLREETGVLIEVNRVVESVNNNFVSEISPANRQKLSTKILGICKQRRSAQSGSIGHLVFEDKTGIQILVLSVTEPDVKAQMSLRETFHVDVSLPEIQARAAEKLGTQRSPTLTELQEIRIQLLREKLTEKMDTLGVTSILAEVKKKNLNYLVLAQGKRTGISDTLQMVGKNEIDAFERGLSRFSTPLELEHSRVQTHKIERPSGSQNVPVVQEPAPAPATDPINIVKMDPLAETQIALLSEGANNKLDEIIQDIEAGRVSRKKIGRYSYVDVPQADTGGRGRWRLAFEKGNKENGKDVYTLKGIVDYHGNTAKVWGM